MTLTLGDRLGSYRSLSALGADGTTKCGERTIAWLGREVAGGMFAERFGDHFDGEARVVDALNRPNIGTLHDVGPNYL